MKSKIIRLNTALVSLCIAASLAIPVCAQAPLPNSPAKRVPDVGAGLPATLINIFLLPALTILGFLTAVYIFLAGLKFIRSKGDPKAAEDARARLTYAIVGLAVIILAAILTQLVDKLVLGDTGAI